tara:strand:- start:31 stop:264 length:234 start_codon:yes stop_codon:yes gene_type:complete
LKASEIILRIYSVELKKLSAFSLAFPLDFFLHVIRVGGRAHGVAFERLSFFLGDFDVWLLCINIHFTVLFILIFINY